MTDLDDLIAEARELGLNYGGGYQDYPGGPTHAYLGLELLEKLADALESATRVPVQGEPNGRPTRAPSGASSGSGAVNAPSRTSVPDAATEIARSLAKASAITGADAEVIAGASVKLAALAEVRDILNRDDFGDDWEHDEWVYRDAAEKKLEDIEAALDRM